MTAGGGVAAGQEGVRAVQMPHRCLGSLCLEDSGEATLGAGPSSETSLSLSP